MRSHGRVEPAVLGKEAIRQIRDATGVFLTRPIRLRPNRFHPTWAEENITEILADLGQKCGS